MNINQYFPAHRRCQVCAGHELGGGGHHPPSLGKGLQCATPLGTRKARGWLPQSSRSHGLAQRDHVPGIYPQPHPVCDPLHPTLKPAGRASRFHDWKLYGERGLANEEVAVWVYDGTLKVEYKAITLSRYTVELQEDRRHLKQVSRPRLAETPLSFRSTHLI